jgi:predicted methyltransferase
MNVLDNLSTLAGHATGFAAAACPARSAVIALAMLCLVACGTGDNPAAQESAGGAASGESAAIAGSAPGATSGHASSHAQHLAAVLDAQSEKVKARYAARNPGETLQFFGIEPGMSVIEVDPGSGWYSRILLPYLGEGGRLIGADYPMPVYRLFDYYSEAELAEKASWPARWPGDVASGVPDGAAVDAFAMGSMPASLEGAVDAILLVRVLHNLADYEEEGAYLSAGLAEIYRALKPGGVVGVVQHMAPESHSDEWASGANGYLKKGFVIAALEAAGFVFEDESTVNKNPLDTPTENESVWRLAPTLDPVDDPELAAAYLAIGESNRMTLRFRKPAPL